LLLSIWFQRLTSGEIWFSNLKVCFEMDNATNLLSVVSFQQNDFTSDFIYGQLFRLVFDLQTSSSQKSQCRIDCSCVTLTECSSSHLAPINVSKIVFLIALRLWFVRQLWFSLFTVVRLSAQLEYQFVLFHIRWISQLLHCPCLLLFPHYIWFGSVPVTLFKIIASMMTQSPSIIG
jgi:hypothetical protein